MDLLQCQKIRKLTTFYRRLKNSGTELEARIDRIEFISELHTILVEEPHSILLEEVWKQNFCPCYPGMSISVLNIEFVNGFVYSSSIC